MRMKSLLALLAIALAVQPAVAQLRRPARGLQRQTVRPTPPAASAAPAAAATPSAGAANSSGEVPAFNWDAAPVDIVLQAYGERVGKTILKDPQVPAATITLKSQPGQKLTNEEYLEAIETVLEMNQIHLEPYGESFIRALPRKDVRKEGIPLIMDPETRLQESGKVVSMMIPFKNIATEEAQKALEGLKSNSGILLVFERTNSILVTDTEQNINRMLEIARMIDVASPVTEVVEYIQIKYANATEVKQVIDSIVQESMKEQEKGGKQPQNTPAQPTSPIRPLMGGLRRPGQQQQQQQTPVNNQSLVMTVSDADRGMIRGKVVTIADERSNKILLITSASNMKFFKEVIAALDVETTPDTVVKVYRLKYAEAEDVSDMINDLIGNSSSSKNSGRGNQNQNAKQGTSGSVTRNTQQAQRKPANQRSGDVKAGELNKENTTVLADKRINGLVVMTQKELVPTIEQIIESMDIKLSQVLIETAIIEVTLGDDINTGVDWVQLGNKRAQRQQVKDSLGRNLFLGERTTTRTTTDKDGNTKSTTETSLLPGGVIENFSKKSSSTVTEKDGSKVVEEITDAATSTALTTLNWVREGYWNGDSGTQYMLGGGAGGAGAATLVDLISGVSTNLINPSGSGINLFLKSDALNIGAVITAAKTDHRAKYIASPIVMTVDNKEAIIEATESRKFYSGSTASSQYGGNTTTYNYTDKDIGIKIKVTPKINPNGTVMLEIEEEYSQLGAGQEVLVSGYGSVPSKESIDTALSRKLSADILLDNRQTVILGGLTETYTSESETGVPILKDIPFIGKWLFGKVSQSENRKELIVFMTPYVLNEAEEAQAEAIRRKKTLSDPRPWDDHGWSASALADPVSKQEQMRRIKEEWKKQDEERKAKIAIEQMKVDRAKKLKEMSKEERDLWLKMHKEELEEEKKEELEEKMQDKESQEELRKLAAEIRAKKLTAAEKEIKEAEAEAAAQNERGKLDAAKKAMAAEDKAAAPKAEKLEEVKPATSPTEVKPATPPAEVKPTEPNQAPAPAGETGNLLEQLGKENAK